jgi:hypothetical protein
VKKLKLIATLVAAGLTLSACGDSGAPSQNPLNAGAGAERSSGSSDPDAAYEARNRHDQAIMVFGRRNSAGRQYADILDMTRAFQYGDATHKAYIDLYWSKADPVDRELLATTLSSEFEQEQDTFKRQDMLAAMAPQLDAYLERVRKIGDVAILTSATARLGRYDMQEKAYPMFGYISFDTRSVYHREDGRLEYGVHLLTQDMDGSVPFMIKVDEARAREIEAVIAPMRDGNGDAYLPVKAMGSVMWAHGGSQGNGWAHFTSVIRPDALELLGPQGQLLLDLQSGELGEYVEVDYRGLQNALRGPDSFDTFRERFNIPYL